MEEFKKKWLGANICYGCTGGCAISSRMMDEMLADIKELRTQVIDECIESLPAPTSDALYNAAIEESKRNLEKLK